MTRDEIVSGAAESISGGSKSFAAASRIFDRQTREKAWLLYCWCRHCDDQCDGQVLGAPAVGDRGSVEALFTKTEAAVAGKAPAELPFQALQLLLSECEIPGEYLIEHLRGFEMDTAGWRPMTQDDLLLYCYRVAGVVGCMMAIIMGVPSERTGVLRRASHLGIAFQLWNIARDIADDHRAGRCYLPQEWLHAAEISGAEILEEAQRRRLVGIVERLTRLAAQHQRSAHEALPDLPFRSRWAVAAASRIYGAIGGEVSARGGAAWDERIHIPRKRKLALLIPSLIHSARASARI